MRWMFVLALISLTAVACDDDDGGGSEAQRRGIGAACEVSDDCLQETDAGVDCLPFKGGYCGAQGCGADADCPAGSACVNLDGTPYCFLVCTDKPECNTHRAAEDESNCSANLDFLEERAGRKVCVPPSAGS
ncbi:MAG: hypothetical protein R3F60_06515 [bacterium]